MRSMPLPNRLRGLARPLLLMAFRIGNIAAKFLLALYTARYLGLVDLGIYGLIVWHDSDAGYSRSRHQ